MRRSRATLQPINLYGDVVQILNVSGQRRVRVVLNPGCIVDLLLPEDAEIELGAPAAIDALLAVKSIGVAERLPFTSTTNTEEAEHE